MRATRRTAAITGLAVALGGISILLAHPLGLVGALLVGAYVISRQAAFAEATVALDRTIAVDQSVEHQSIRQHDTVEGTITASLDAPTPLDVTVTPGWPSTAATTDPVTLRFPDTRTQASHTVPVTWPVSGRHRVAPATVAIADTHFRETIETGSTPAVTVEPIGVRDVHVGIAGRRVLAAYGSHKADRIGAGVEPARVRAYVHGDEADRIDWKATARLEGTYVRDFEIETDRATWLVVDRRASMATGGPGTTKLDHLRTVGLALLQSARGANDPLGLLVVDDDGIATRIDPGANPDTYAAVRRHLLTLRTPTTPSSPRSGQREPIDATTAAALAAPLAGDTDAFAETLRPFFDEHVGYHRLVADRPLYGAVAEAVRATQSSGLVAILTDDAHLGELVEATKRAVRANANVLAYLAPDVLYTPAVDPEDAYHRYVVFEDQRRRLAGLDPRVTALEVGPSDRLGTILAAGRRPRRQVIA